MQKKNIFNKIQLTLWNQSGESYVDTGVKMLLAIVIGALLLTGIYSIFGDTILTNVSGTIQGFFDQTPTLNGGGSGGGNGGNGGGGEPVLAANFADNSWGDIAYACQNDMVPDTWSIGDVKTMMVGENEVEIMIIGKNHDEYADGGIAPLTFMTKQVIEYRAMNATATTAGGWDGSAMYTYLNTELIETLELKDSIKAVKKTTNIGYRDSGNKIPTETEVTDDKLFLLSYIEVDSTKTGIYAEEGATYEAFTDNASRKLKDVSGLDSYWWLRTPNYTFYSGFGFINSPGGVNYSNANDTIGIAFAFCF